MPVRHLTRLCVVLCGALFSGGCFQFSTLLTVRGDGTGTIQQRLLFTQAALAQLRSLSIMRGSRGQDFDPITAEQAAAAAAAMGPGVTYVSSTPLTTAEGQGRESTYRFTDINQLRLAELPSNPGGVSVRAQGLGALEPVSFTLAKTPEGNALLRIVIPRPPFATSGASAMAERTGVSVDQLATFKPMLAGARASIAVRPVGRLIGTNSAYVEGNRVTLIDFDLDQFLNDESALLRLRGVSSEEQAKAVLKDLPGIKLNLEPEITVEFTPQ
jgi:hypothetical protein